MFSYRAEDDESIPIAKEAHSKKIIYLNMEEPQAESNRVHYSSAKLSECVSCGKRFKSVQGYKYHINHVCNLNQRYHLISDNPIEPLPTTKRQVIYACGSQESGKSYRLASYIYHWIHMFPDRPVVLISRHDYDPTFDMNTRDGFGNLERHIQRMKPSMDWIERKFKLEEFQDCLLAFDDITCSNWSDNPDYKEQAKENKLIQDYLIELAVDCVQNARHTNTGVFITNHNLYDKNRGLSKVLSDITDTIVFPPTASDHHLTYYLKDYMGLNKENIDEIKASQSRWVWIHRNAPRYYITDHEVKRYDLRLSKSHTGDGTVDL